MIAVLLAAGVSSRLRPLTNDIPKSLLHVGGTPLLQRVLRSLQDSGIRECVIVTGYFKEKIETFVRSLSLSLSVCFVENPLFATTGNNYSLWCARPFVDGKDIVMLDADILFDPKLLTLLLASPHPNALILRRIGHLGEEEIKVSMDRAGAVSRIGKDVDPGSAAGESIGIEKFSAASTLALFRILDRRKAIHEFYEASFQEMIDQGTEIHAVDSAGFPCLEIDTFEDLAAAQALAQTIP